MRIATTALRTIAPAVLAALALSSTPAPALAQTNHFFAYPGFRPVPPVYSYGNAPGGLGYASAPLPYGVPSAYYPYAGYVAPGFSSLYRRGYSSAPYGVYGGTTNTYGSSAATSGFYFGRGYYGPIGNYGAR